MAFINVKNLEFSSPFLINMIDIFQTSMKMIIIEYIYVWFRCLLFFVVHVVVVVQ